MFLVAEMEYPNISVTGTKHNSGVIVFCVRVGNVTVR